MKLRTKLGLLCGAAVCLAALLGTGLIFSMCRRTVLEQAENSAYTESQSIFREFRSYCYSLGTGELDGDPSIAVYWLKSRQDDYSILRQYGVTLYNQTLLDPEELLAQAGRDHSVFLLGRRLMVYDNGVEAGFHLIHVVDVTDTYLALDRLAVWTAAITLGVMALAFLLVFWMIRRALRPLQALSEAAGDIAAGAYDRRVPESGRDEIAQLGRDFNTMARAVEEHIREVEASEEKKTLFMGSLTHELKTPLTAISGYAQTLRAVKLSDEDREAALEYIDRESFRLDRLSKKMLRLLELDQGELGREQVGLGQLSRAAAETCTPAARAKGVEIEIDDCPGQWVGDRELLTEAVINLIDNAVKASVPGSAVNLYVREGALVVEDHGCGIPPEEIERLTEPFYMVDKSRSRQSGGAGLGLALVAVILRRHGLRLKIESQVGKGTSVYVSFTTP